ncbi:MAG: hypothetical protein ABSF29_07360 [Tepidisphaeraceae bacterium]|jgi:anti-sigma factor RsiW
MENIEAMLCAYVEGDLDDAGRKEIEKHLADHPQHRKMLEDLVKQRDLLRQLPRVTAPGDVGEGLRGQMERSILLDSQDSMQLPRAAPGFRWPQLITAAAIFLLGASLVLIVYRTVVPTFKPASYTQVSPGSAVGAKPPSDIEADIEASRAQSDTSPAAPEAAANPATQPAPAVVAMAAPMQPLPQSFAARPAAPPATPSTLDWNQIRRELKSSGYDISRESIARNNPLVLLVNAPDAAGVGQQISQFLSSQNGISWWSAPEASPAPTTMPTIRQAIAKATTQPANRQQLKTASIAEVARNVASTQPAVRIYVACGLTPQGATALQQSLTNQPADAAATVQVTLESAELLAGAPDSAAPKVSMAVAGAATGASSQPAATAPSGSANSSLVDAVIVIQPPAMQMTPTPTPTPAAQPATRPSVPATPTLQPATGPDFK